jgi:transketolase
MLRRAFNVFKNTADRPTLIIVDSHIGYGAPTKQGTAAAHGEPLGEAEIKATKRTYGWPEDAKFLVPDGVRERFRDGIGKRSRELRTVWESNFQTYKREFPQLAAEIEKMQRRELPDGWDKDLPVFPPDQKAWAGGRREQVLNAVAKNVPGS